ncbi:Uncharacterised protein [Neisseria mucosa]|nr:Uncharacterised protein [Neisseria mucosa]
MASSPCPDLNLIHYRYCNFKFSDDLRAYCFRGRSLRYALVLSTNFVAWALPTNHSRFQTTCPSIIFVGRTHATDTAPAKTDRQSKHERSSENPIFEFSDDLCVNRFRGRSPRYGAYVINKLCSVDYAHESLKIEDSSKQPTKNLRNKKSRPIRSAFNLSD